MEAAKEQELIALERRFWESLVDEDADTATRLLAEPALMVSAMGAMQFDHAAYRKMATQGTMVLRAYALSEMKVLFAGVDTAILTYRVKQDMAKRGESATTTQHMMDSSVWTRQGGEWRCAMHTETPLKDKDA